MIPGTLLPRTTEKTALLKSLCKDWACTHCQCSWCLFPRSGHVIWIFAASRNVHSLIKFNTEKWLYLCSNTVSGCATVCEACRCFLTVEAEVDLRPLHADFRWQGGAGTGFSPCPSCFPSQYLSISAPNSYFVHLPLMLCDPTNWHHACHWHRTLHAERHHKHDMQASLGRNLAVLV